MVVVVGGGGGGGGGGVVLFPDRIFLACRRKVVWARDLGGGGGH